jgi:integrase
MKGCRPLTDEEVEEIVQSFTGEYSKRNKAMFILGVKSGFRISEILSLTIGDVVAKGSIIDTVHVKRCHMKKKTEGRTIPLNPAAKAALYEWIKQLIGFGLKSPDIYLFRSRKGENRPITRIQAWRIVKRACDANELQGKVATHSMRKTYANKVYNYFKKQQAEGKPVDPFHLTSKALGHRNINNTDKYLSFLDSDVNEAILSI